MLSSTIDCQFVSKLCNRFFTLSMAFSIMSFLLVVLCGEILIRGVFGFLGLAVLETYWGFGRWVGLLNGLCWCPICIGGCCHIWILIANVCSKPIGGWCYWLILASLVCRKSKISTLPRRLLYAYGIMSQ